METYKKQKCEGQEPVSGSMGPNFSVRRLSMLFLFTALSLIGSSVSFHCSSPAHGLLMMDIKIIWKAQAICETHNFQLVIRENTAVTEPMYSHQFYVWDHVSLVFHTKDVLTVPKRKLKASLSCCELDEDVDLSNGENFSSLDEAGNSLKFARWWIWKRRLKKKNINQWRWRWKWK